MTDRVIALVDMDCFYCQVEERLNPELKGKPTVVVQYNPWKGGGIIAVNYEARAQGVKRGMRGDQAKQLCPDVVLCSVPMIREKADLARYRNAGKEVIDVMCKFSECVQRASIDEAYLDLTDVVNKRMLAFRSPIQASNIPNTFVVGYSSDSSNDEGERSEGTGSWLNDLYCAGLDDLDTKKLAVGAVIVEEMRKSILDITGFKCSAGIAHNKILAKLAAGIHKPNRQTILPHASVARLFSSLPVHKIRNLGGKLGRELEDVHGVKMMSDLLKFSQAELVKLCDDRMGGWLYQIARGFDDEPVQARLISKSIACCKNFPGKMSLSQGKEVEHWLNKLAEELLERLLDDEAMNQRRAQHMVFSIRLQEGAGRRGEVGSSKSVPLSGYNHEKLVNSARTCLKKFCSQDPNTKVWSPIITFLGLSAGKFVDTSNKLKQFFNNMQTSRSVRAQKSNETTEESDLQMLHDSEKCNEVIAMPSEMGKSEGKSEYFREVNEDLNMDVDTHPSVTTNKRKSSNDGPLSNESKSSLEESGGPSFFERMLLDDVSNNGKRIKLNVLPVVPQPSPGKLLEDKPPDISDPAVFEVKAKSSKVNDFFKKSPVGCASRDKNDIGKMSKPSKEAVTSFFTKNAPAWVDPSEIFPDVESIDEATLAVFPPSYQKRILELKRAKAEERKRLERTGSKDDGAENVVVQEVGFSAYDKNKPNSMLHNDETRTSGGSSSSRVLPSNHNIVDHSQVGAMWSSDHPQEETDCVPFFNTRPPSCVSTKGLTGQSAGSVLSQDLHPFTENGGRSCDISGKSPIKSFSSKIFVPKQSQRHKIHDSQQPSTSKCGLEEKAMEIHCQRSPEDIFAWETSAGSSSNGPSHSRDSSCNDDMFERQDSPKSPKTDSSISKELEKYTIHDSQVPSTSKCHLPGLGGGSSPEDIFAQEPCWQPSFSARPPSSSAQLSWRGPSPISDDSNSDDQVLPKISCPDCQILLQSDEVDEHADFHFALKLQDEMNQSVPAARPITAPSLPTKPVKRKAQSKSSKKPDSKKMKSIDSFFKKAS